MKHIIAAGLTAICATTGAWAQSSVTLYGSLDAGIAYISNAGGSSKWIEEQGNMQPDRWGLKGVEDLGGFGYFFHTIVFLSVSFFQQITKMTDKVVPFCLGIAALILLLE